VGFQAISPEMKVCSQQTDHREAVGFNRTARDSAVSMSTFERHTPSRRALSAPLAEPEMVSVNVRSSNGMCF
jgi:hypothetical protein